MNIWQWCRQHHQISDIEQERWFLKQSQDPTIQMYKIMVLQKGKASPVGVCGFTSIDHLHRRAEFSLYIAYQAQGFGIGKGALTLLLQEGFGNHNFHLVYGETFDGNPAAKTFEKLGFVKEGTRRDFYFKNGRYLDAHLYSITEDEWNQRKLLSLQ